MKCHVSLILPLDMKNIHRTLQYVLFLQLLTKFQFDAQRDSYDSLPQVICLGCNLGAYRNVKFLCLYLRKYSETRYEICAQASPQF